MATKDISDIITLNNNGLNTLDYAEIVQVLLERYRKIYGYDIELDPRSADGRFIYDVATIINTGVDIIKGLYNNLNPNIAQGNFLDILSSLTNIQRLSATYSYAKVKITNNTNINITYAIPSTTDENRGKVTYNYDDLNLIDDSGNEWYVDTTYKNITINKNSSITLKYRCSVSGKITTSSLNWEVASANDLTSNCVVSIDTLAIGDNEESDEELRTRRASVTNNGLTILGSLKGNLLDIDGIKDAYIQSYAQNTGEEETIYINNEEIKMVNHSVCILLRYNEVNEPDETEIGETIINYLTSGVNTMYLDNDARRNYNKYRNESGLYLLQQIYWYKCEAVHPTITIAIALGNNYGGSETDNLIASAITDYLDNLKINQKYTSADLLNVVQGSDPKYQNATTFFARSVSVGTTEQENKGTYFEYGNKYRVEHKQNSLNEYIITITYNGD